MKRRILRTLFTLASAMCLASFAACIGAEKHNWQSTWTYGPDEHWHECADEDCNTIADVNEHTIVDGQCSVCGYKPHHWNSTWSYGPAQHWHECGDSDCEIITDFGEHTMVNGKCSVCGYAENNE